LIHQHTIDVIKVSTVIGDISEHSKRHFMDISDDQMRDSIENIVIGNSVIIVSIENKINILIKTLEKGKYSRKIREHQIDVSFQG